jgi:hypothetical protein
MKNLATFLEYFNLAAFVLLGLVTFKQWRQRHDEGAKWVFLTFGSLAVVAIIALFLPEHSDSTLVEWVTRVLIVVILLFPYFLYRLSASFMQGRSWFDNLAAALTAVVVVWGALIPEFPEEGEPQPTSIRIFVFAVVIQWVLLSAAVAIRFWRGGRGKPSVAGNRMRLLSIASVLFSAVIVISGFEGGTQSVEAEIVSSLITLLAVVAFFVAFAPPAWLRANWRRPSEQALRRGTMELMASGSSDEIMDVLLPQAMAIVGGEGISVMDKDGKVLGSRGMDDATLERAAQLPRGNGHSERNGDGHGGLVHLDFGFGTIAIQTGPYTPFFGQDEIDLLGALGALANLSLERVAADQLRMQLEKASIRRQQALEINDNIVQGLAVAKYSFDLGQHEKARDAVEGTLVAARAIISELIDEFGDDLDFGPGALTRDRAATGFMDSELTQQRQEAEQHKR